MLEQRVSDLNLAIEQSRGGIATLWEYTASLSELSIRISWHGSSENIHLMCNGCIRLEAAAVWSNARFEWLESENGKLELIDKDARFFLMCGQIRVRRNVDPMFITT